jgi:hypothetical protein
MKSLYNDLYVEVGDLNLHFDLEYNPPTEGYHTSRHET